MRFEIVVKKGKEEVVTIVGRDVDPAFLKVIDVTQHLIETERYLELITGLRFHINQHYGKEEAE